MNYHMTAKKHNVSRSHSQSSRSLNNQTDYEDLPEDETVDNYRHHHNHHHHRKNYHHRHNYHHKQNEPLTAISSNIMQSRKSNDDSIGYSNFYYGNNDEDEDDEDLYDVDNRSLSQSSAQEEFYDAICKLLHIYLDC
jgi:hypothetical protein